jgi:hypothetical protein
MLVQVLFSIRSERQLMEQVRYNLLFHWFIGLAIDDSVWYHSIFSKNSDRLLENAVVESHTTRWGGSAVDGRTTRHTCYADSQRIRKHIEEHFGWRKTGGRIRQTVYRGLKRVDQHFKLTMTASNIVRMARLLTARPQGALQ